MIASTDTIGRRLSMALEEQRAADGDRGEAMYWKEQGRDTAAERWWRSCALHTGAVYGHAYRAAELAYELGQREAS